jgi:ERCC4-type nuclease
MLIKIDCRERELLELMLPAVAAVAATPTPVAEPDHYLMDLGDGMMMKVPIPKTHAALPPQTTMKRKSLATPASGATRPTVLKNYHEIKSERLPLGDIILHDPGQGRDIVLFERKTLNDLAASIQDGRYKEQSFRLLQTSAAATAASAGFHPHNIVYIIEGDITQYEAKRNKNNRITKTALQSAMVSLLYYKGFSVVRTMNLGETADFIIHFADKVAKESADGATPAYTRAHAHAHAQPEHHNDTESDATTHDTAATAQAYSEVAAKKEKRDYITRENIGEIMLAQVPGVSPKVAAAILAKYGGSVYEFLADLRRKIGEYEESLSPEMSPPSPPVLALEIVAAAADTTRMPTQDAPAPMNKNKLKHVSECFKDITSDGKRGIGKATIEKLCYFLS